MRSLVKVRGSRRRVYHKGQTSMADQCVLVRSKPLILVVGASTPLRPVFT